MNAKFGLFLLLPLLLTSCQNSYSIYVEKDESLTSFSVIGSANLKSKITNKEEFAVLISNKASCSSCITAENNVSEYVNQTKKTIYQYTYQIVDDPIIYEFSNIFSSSYPSLYLIKDENVLEAHDYNLFVENFKERRIHKWITRLKSALSGSGTWAPGIWLIS